MNKRVLYAFWLALFLFGCATPQKQTSTVMPTSTTDPYLGFPISKTTEETPLYYGPGNAGYEVLSNLPNEELVILLGEFGDFIKAFVPVIQKNGFIWREKLDVIPLDLPVLSTTDVPWITGDYIAENCMGPFTSIDKNGVATRRDFTTGPGNYASTGAPIKLGAETRFTIQFSTDNGNAMVLDLMDTPVYPYQDAFVGHRKVQIKYENDQYSIGFVDGRSYDDGYFSIPLTEIKNDPFQLVIIGPEGNAIEIRDLNGRVLNQYVTKGSFFFEGVTAEFPDGIFPEKTLYVNCSTVGPTIVTMSEHKIIRAPTGVWETPNEPLPQLRDLALQHGIDIMVPVEGWRLGDLRYSTIIDQQISMNYGFGLFPPLTWIGIGKYNLEFLDYWVDYSLMRGWKVRLALVSPYIEDQPGDLQSSNFTRDEYIEILHDYVTTFVCRYKDKVSVWDIAGEAPGTYVAQTPDFWRERIGPDYIEMAFRWARECDPDGELVFTGAPEFVRDEETQLYFNTMYEMVTDMLSRDTPIDGIGMEGHFFLPSDSLIPPTKEAVIKSMRDWGDLGLDVYITEMDVTLSLLSGTRDEKWALQAQVYKTMMDACIEAGNCKSFGVFGIDDQHAWSMCMPGLGCPPDVPPDALWFDENYQPKPAFYAVFQSLQEH